MIVNDYKILFIFIYLMSIYFFSFFLNYSCVLFGQAVLDSWAADVNGGLSTLLTGWLTIIKYFLLICILFFYFSESFIGCHSAKLFWIHGPPMLMEAYILY